MLTTRTFCWGNSWYVDEYPQCIILEIPDTLTDSRYEFDWVFPEIPIKNCIVGMLLTRPISISYKRRRRAVTTQQ